MTPLIILCCSEEEDDTILVQARRAVDVALERLHDMRPDGSGSWSAPDPRQGYVERSIDEDGEEILRIRLDCTSTDDDVVLAEAPLLGEPPHREDPCDAALVEASLERWRSAFAGCRRLTPPRTGVQRAFADLMGDATTAHCAGRASFAVIPPTIHVAAQILSLAPLGAEFDAAEHDLCRLAERTIGNVAWLRPQRSSATVRWSYTDPSSHGFNVSCPGPDPMAALRAHSALASACAASIAFPEG
jgi:hypothetical protein